MLVLLPGLSQNSPDDNELLEQGMVGDDVLQCG
jgi:hypothetical protein